MTPPPALLAALVAGAAGLPAVEVELLSSRPCQALTVEGPGGTRSLALRDGRLLLDGRPVASPLRLPAATWRVRVPSPAERTVPGELAVAAAGGRLRLLARIPLEAYVAWTVASETAPGTPAEALRAQAVVARSYALAAGRRHADVDLCDLAHCQVLRGAIARRHREAAARAAQATRGEVLRLPSGAVALAPFHSACGGHTADPGEAFGGQGTGAAAAPDDGCPAAPWRARVPRAVFEAVAEERLGSPAAPEALEWRLGEGGHVVQVAHGARAVGGEAFARALDARLGHRTVRSARFRARTARGAVVLEGSGLGHGVGLCQAGAALRAREGATYRQILAHYYPLARIRRDGP